MQARRNGWELRGWQSNTRAPINRETYRVLDVRPDGGLTVAQILGRGEAGEGWGSRCICPTATSPPIVTLGYASTVHAAEGRTVDTGHSVFGPGVDLAGMLVPMTRGRECNTAWVITTPLAADAQTGETFDVHARTARAILADVVENAREELSALAERERAEVEARSTMTHVDQLIAVAEQFTTGRTSAALDRLSAAGLLSPPERAQLAADDTIWSLERLLRTAELSGHNPDQVLAAAVSLRELDGARSLAQVIHHRITHPLEGQLTPNLTSATDLIPRDAPADYRAWLAHRAEAADTCRHELGAEVAEQAPTWALDALGPVPEDVVERQEREHRAGWAAAWRELAGHTDEQDPLGAAPPRGQLEKAALFRAAHEALRLIDAGHEEAGMTDGRLRMRVRALEQEEAWAPRHVDDELAATHAAADNARADATVWAARAEAPDIAEADREQLRAAAADAQRKAEELAEQVAVLEEADTARARWFVETAVTRDKAERARAELRARGVDPDDTSDRVRAADWLDAHRSDQAAEDDEREIHNEHDYYEPVHEDAAATAVPPTDVRDGRAHASEHAEPAQRRRVLTLDETAEAVARAQLALVEIAQRRQADTERAARESEEVARAEELARWAQHERTDTVADDVSYDALER